jgi:hypothetical protein
MVVIRGPAQSIGESCPGLAIMNQEVGVHSPDKIELRGYAGLEKIAKQLISQGCIPSTLQKLSERWCLNTVDYGLF